MKDILSFTGSDILGTPEDRPELIFTGDPTIAQQEYRKLVSNWHPDSNPNVDPRVISHVNVLYDRARLQFSLGIWVLPNEITFTDVTGKTFNVKYKTHKDFELGDMYIGQTVVAYSFFKDNSDLYENALKMTRFKFHDNKMRENVERYLPKIVSSHETSDRYFLIVKKTPDLLVARDVLTHLNKVNPKDVAWILSSLYDLTCYLKYLGVVHAGISLDNLYISPKDHSVSLLGGWWYATKVGHRLLALTSTALNYCPSKILSDHIADHSLDLELLRACGREMLGDINGSKLLHDPAIPNPLYNWLIASTTGDALEEYATWQKKVLINSFGDRRYHEMKVSSTDLYG